LTVLDRKPALFDFLSSKDKKERNDDFNELTEDVGAFLQEANRVSDAVANLRQAAKAKK